MRFDFKLKYEITKNVMLAYYFVKFFRICVVLFGVEGIKKRIDELFFKITIKNNVIIANVVTITVKNNVVTSKTVIITVKCAVFKQKA